MYAYKFFAVALMATCVLAQDYTGQPECAKLCLQKVMPVNGCELTDVACACKQESQDQLVRQAGQCIVKACNFAELATARTAGDAVCNKYGKK